MSSSSLSGPSERDRLLDAFAGYLRRERGVSVLTVDLPTGPERPATVPRPRLAGVTYDALVLAE